MVKAGKLNAVIETSAHADQDAWEDEFLRYDAGSLDRDVANELATVDGLAARAEAELHPHLGEIIERETLDEQLVFFRRPIRSKQANGDDRRRSKTVQPALDNFEVYRDEDSPTDLATSPPAVQEAA